MDGNGGGVRSADLERAFPAERAKAFVDAVVAIALTLLILPLMESAAELGAGDTGVGEWFAEHTDQIVTFLISFVMIGFFWTGHHRVFAQVVAVSNGLLWLNLAWLLTVVWMPVATALTGHSGTDDRPFALVYIASMAATSALWLLIRVHLARHPDLHAITAERLRQGVAVALADLLLFGVAAGLAGFVPGVGYFALLVMWLSDPARRLVSPWLRRWTPAPGTASAG
ncbi:TMEM175 family protein [Nocardiopsis protaetiae]|uniref:TMEM175 family protein n=1 Tax=Nocardiopsis protaetiae TaxID=3382270 RepID=UPI00387AE642